MSKMRKRLIAIVLAVMMVVGVIPEAQVVQAAESIITRVDLTYDAEKIELNTAWTERDVNYRVYDYTDEMTQGCHLLYGMLQYYNETAKGPYGIGDGTNNINNERKYIIDYCLELDKEEGNYDWCDEIKSLTSLYPIATAESCPEFQVYVNGVKRTDFYIMYSGSGIDIYVPLEPASTTPIVTGIDIEGNDVSVEVGGTHTFSASVTGSVTDKSVNWSVEGANSTATSITSAGKLTVGNDETAETITVKATSVADSTKTATKSVTVLEQAPMIDKVTVTPSEDVKVGQKGKLQFEVSVEGTQVDKSVTWSIKYQYSADTKISQDGLLTVGKNESANGIEVTVTPNQDSSKAESVWVTIVPLVKMSSIALTYDADILKLNPHYTEGEVNSRANESQGVTSENVSFYAEGIKYYNDDYKCWYGIGDGTDSVSKDKQYGIMYRIYPDSGYDWIDEVWTLTEYHPVATSVDCPNFEVTINGEKCTNFTIQYDTSYGYIDICVPIELVQLSIEDVTVDKIEDKKYTGSEITPEPIVKLDEVVLTKGVDYTLVYEDNINAGTATVKINGIGNYTGTKIVTFNIIKDNAINKDDSDKPGTSDDPSKKDISDKSDTTDNSVTTSELKKGDTYTDKLSGVTYIVTSNSTITYASSKTNSSSVVISDEVKINGKKYKVTEIKANAFKNNKNIKKITIGKNIKKIGKNAFYGCKKLKKIIIKTTKLTKKSVGKNAFAKINKKAKVKVPKKKLKTYKKVLKARGIKGRKQKITSK